MSADLPTTRAAVTQRRLDTREARQEAAQIAALIAPFGARCSKRQGIHLIGLVRRLCDVLDEARAELREASPYRDWYGRLVEDYNGICEVLRDLGIDVAQPSGASDWHWRCGEQRGTAPTIAGAFAAALPLFPAPIVEAISVLAAHCREHGYSTVIVANTGGAVFHRESILESHAEALAALAAAETIGAPSSGAAETAARALAWWARYIGPQAADRKEEPHAP